MRGLRGSVCRPAAVRGGAGGPGGVVEGPRGGVVVGARAEAGVGRLDVRPGGVGRCRREGGGGGSGQRSDRLRCKATLSVSEKFTVQEFKHCTPPALLHDHS